MDCGNRKIQGDELKSYVYSNHSVIDKDGEVVMKHDLDDKTLYNVNVKEFEDSEGWTYRTYRILDGLRKPSSETCN